MKRKNESVSAPYEGKKTKRQVQKEKNIVQQIKRPDLAPLGDSIIFQQIDIDYTITQNIERLSGIQEDRTVAVRLFGITEDGNSVYCQAFGFKPYFFIPAPPNFTQRNCASFRIELDKKIAQNITNQGKYNNNVQSVQIERKQSILGFHGDLKIPFLRISMASPKLVPLARRLLEDEEFDIPDLEGYRATTHQTYESNIAYALRFMIDKDIVGMSWLKIPLKNAMLVTGNKKQSTCQIELNINYNDIESLGAEGDWAISAPLRVLSFDIECANRKGIFPEPEKDAVIQIANIVKVMGQDTVLARNVFTLNTCSAIVGAEVKSYQREQDMLLAWAKFMIEVDPDIITGYNICNFDFWYLFERAKTLKLSDFSYLSRMRNEHCSIRDAVFSSKAYGRRESRSATLWGRVQMDMMQVIQRDYKLRSYSLNAVSAHFLKEQKEDVHYSIITDLFLGSDDDRRRLAVYCIKDAYLPLRLMDKLMVLYNYIEMSRVTGVPLGYLLARGQQIKVVSQLYRRAMQDNLLVPALKVNKSAGDDGVAYEGATVIEPKKGYYDIPITTLDFSSLYPSIMMAHNLCYSTLVPRSAVQFLSPDEYITTPTGDHFVKTDVKPGILPQILEQLLAARKKAKKELQKETNPFKRAVLDGRQLALKISANSVYGFTGATVGKLPCLEISASVTSYGRRMIDKTKEIVEEHYTVKNGYKWDAEVIYGDTDSVMVKFGTDSVAEAMDLGKEAAEMVTKTFVRPINLEFEKVYFPYLLLNKKRYAGLYWTNPEKHDKLDTKGIVTVRRDNCGLVKNIIGTCLDMILLKRDLQGAQDYAKKMISDLLCNRIDLSLLVITKAYVKKDYAVKQAHVELAERMRKRDPGTAPNVGDRVPYVIVKGAKNAKAYEKAEDPLYVLEHNVPIDVNHYLEHQVQKPLLDIFGPILPNANSLLTGDHTRSRSITAPKTSGIGLFVVKQLRCMACNSALPKGLKTLCAHCQKMEAQIYQERALVVASLEQQFSRVWTQCQNCQGSLHQKVLCTSRDCPIFYMRKKIQKSLKDAQIELERFSITDW